MIAKDRDARPRNAHELVQELNLLEAQLSWDQPTRPTHPQRSESERQRKTQEAEEAREAEEAKGS
jgi:hypothetical protein